MPPHETPNSFALHASEHVNPLAHPVLDEHPGVTMGPPEGHCVGSLLRHAMPPPFDAVQLTKARAAPQPIKDASAGSKSGQAARVVELEPVELKPLPCARAALEPPPQPASAPATMPMKEGHKKPMAKSPSQGERACKRHRERDPRTPRAIFGDRKAACLPLTRVLGAISPRQKPKWIRAKSGSSIFSGI
jgi:hypothetical protein